MGNFLWSFLRDTQSTDGVGEIDDPKMMGTEDQ